MKLLDKIQELLKKKNKRQALKVILKECNR